MHQISRIRLWTCGFLLLAVCFFLISCTKEQTTEKKQIRPVKTIIVQQPVSIIWRRFPAKIIANKEANLGFQVKGILIELPVKEGEIVHQHQLIARIDPKRYKEAENERMAKYLQAKAEYLRAKALLPNGFVSKSDYDARKYRYKMTMANLNNAQRDLKDTSLYAPFNGVVAKRFVENFENVRERQAIVRLQDTTHVDVEIDVPEAIMLRIREAVTQKKPYVYFESAPQRKFNLTLKEFAAIADPDTQTYRVVFTLKTPQDLTVLPGMTATVGVALRDYRRGGKPFYRIPASAVFYPVDKQPSVWVVDGKTKRVKAVRVDVGRLMGSDIQVFSGITSGMRVVVAGAEYLQPEQQVSLVRDKTQQKDSE